LSNAPTPEGRGPERPNDTEPLFPSEGPFNPVVPLSEIDDAPAPLTLPAVDPADVGKPAEAAWAREAHRAGRKEEEETLVAPRAARAPRGRPSWLAPAVVIAVSVVAGLASGTYLIWSSQRAAEPQRSAQAAPEAPPPQPAPTTAATPAPVLEKAEASDESAKVERSNESATVERSNEVVKVEKPREAARPAPTPRADAEAREVKPAPKPARTQSAAQARSRVTTAERRPPAPPSTERALPISSPPPTARSKKVIQWP
jgi:hypothetical protein